MVELSLVKVFCNQVFSITFFNYMVTVGPPRLLHMGQSKLVLFSNNCENTFVVLWFYDIFWNFLNQV